jgi:hypothetical protein
MGQLILKLWNDDEGFAYMVEVIFVVTLLVLGTVAALIALRSALTAEAHELANAIMALSQAYSFTAQTNCQASVAGSSAFDATNTILSGSIAADQTSNVNDNPCD